MGAGGAVVGAVVLLAAISQAGRPTSPAAADASPTPRSAPNEIAAAPTAKPAETAIPTVRIIPSTPQPTAKPTPTPKPTPTDPPPPPTTYAVPSSRQWAKIVRSPDDHLGETYKVWACITQFDAATGDDTFRAQASYRNQDYWYSDGDNAIFSALLVDLSDFVQDDVVVMNVTVFGSFDYDTQIGGSTTAPLFWIDKITHKGSC
jgi:hypothetical protein